MKKYTVIDINSDKHIVYAHDVSNTPEGDHVAIKFWRYNNGKTECCSFFNFDNIICITEDMVNIVEILDSEDSAEEPVEVKKDGLKTCCATCKHENNKITDEPCMDCWYCNRWEAKNDKATL